MLNFIPNNFSASSFVGKVPEVYKINLGLSSIIFYKAIFGERQISLIITLDRT